MAEYTTRFHKSGGFSVDEATITALWKQVKEFLGNDDAEISIQLEDNHTIVVKDLKELFDDTFIRGNKIEQIEISAYRYDSGPIRRISVALRCDRKYNAVSVALAGERQQCTARRAEIENVLKGRALWYGAWIYSGRSYWITAALSCIVGAMIPIFLDKFELPLYQLVGMSLIASLFIMPARLIFERLLFPQLIFEFGLSAGAGAKAAYWRNLMGVGVILALFVGIVAGLIVEWLK